MKKLSSAVAVMVIAMAFASCDKVTGDGPVVTENRNIVNFAGVDLRVSANVYFKQDPNYKVEISAQQNVLNVIETYVSDNKLVVKFKSGVNLKSHEPIVINVSAPNANRFRISGSGSISTTGDLTPAAMELDISGSGNLNIAELHTGQVDADISGSGNIKVTAGAATQETLKISGSGDIDLGGIAANSANTTTSGSGNTRVNASQNLTVRISGSGSVYYKGTPVINTSISGSGKLIHF